MFSGASFHYLEALLAAWLRTEEAEGELNSRQKRGSLERLRPHQPQDFFPRPQYAELCASLRNKAVTADKNTGTAINTVHRVEKCYMDLGISCLLRDLEQCSQVGVLFTLRDTACCINCSAQRWLGRILCDGECLVILRHVCRTQI